MGTVERALWREGMKTDRGVGELVENLHDFKEVLELEYQPGGWYRNAGLFYLSEQNRRIIIDHDVDLAAWLMP